MLIPYLFELGPLRKSQPLALPTPTPATFGSKFAASGVLYASYHKLNPVAVRDNAPNGVLSKNFCGNAYDKDNSCSLTTEPS